MINFNYETDFAFTAESNISKWIINVISEEKFTVGEINYIFCDDDYLHKINIEFLNHNTLTDIISFDYTQDKIISGDIYISIDRVKENARIYKVSFKEELCRVIVHGVLHYCGYKDKTEEDAKIMSAKENFYIAKYQ